MKNAKEKLMDLCHENIGYDYLPILNYAIKAIEFMERVESISEEKLKKRLYYATDDCCINGTLDEVMKHEERCKKQAKAIKELIRGKER